MKYKFKAKDIKTGEWVEGDLIYANVRHFQPCHVKCVEKPMIVKMHIHGGMLWAGSRHVIDESTIELIRIKNSMEDYILISWPESQELMEIEGYEDHSSLADCEMFGPCAYFVEKEWYESLEEEE